MTTPALTGSDRLMLKFVGQNFLFLIVVATVAESLLLTSKHPDDSSPVRVMTTATPLFQAVQSPGARLDVGMNRAADELGASITQLTVDSTDVERIVRLAETRLASAASEGTGERKKDSGHTMLPLIVLLALIWSRKGWVVQ